MDRAASAAVAVAIRSLVVATALTMAAIAPVSAKMPFFDVLVEPVEPVAGEPIRIVVRTWSDGEHTTSVDWQVGSMAHVLVARDATGRAADVPVVLHRLRPGLFDARITLPAGDWLLVAFPDRSGWSTPKVPEGYPDTIPLRVQAAERVAPGAAGKAPSDGLVAVQGVALAALTALGIAGMGVLRRRSIRMQPPSRDADELGD